MRELKLQLETGENLLGLRREQKIIAYEPVTYRAEGAYGYTFEVCGKATIEICWVERTGGVTPVLRANNTTQDAYTRYAGTLPRSDMAELTITPQEGACSIRNLAMYGRPFSSGIPPYAKEIPLELAQLVKERGQLAFRALAGDWPMLLNGTVDVSPLIHNDGHGRLRIPASLEGELTVRYAAHPTQVTAATPDDFVPELDEEAQALMPLCMAARLYAEDDPTMAVMYFNQFEGKKQQLNALGEYYGKTAEWTSESGWC